MTILIPIDRISKLSIFSAAFNGEQTTSASSLKNESGNDKWSPGNTLGGESGEIEETVDSEIDHRRPVSCVCVCVCAGSVVRHTRMDRDRDTRDEFNDRVTRERGI